MDFKAAEKLSIKTRIASGLPGKVAPYTAGKIMHTCVTDALAERGFLI